MKNKLAAKEILHRLEEERFARRQAEKAGRKQRNKLRSGRDATFGRATTPNQLATRRDRKWHDIPVPKQLDLMSNREESCAFFSDVRSLVRSGRRARLDFEQCDSISPEALIYLLGQVHRLRLEYGENRVTGTYPRSRKIERLLEESGFFHVLRIRRRGIAARKSRSTRYLSCKSHTSIRGEEIPKIRDELLGTDLRMPPAVGKKVFRALTEAMTNVSHHAYHNKSVRNRQVAGRWWLGAQLSLKKNMFTLTFYDAGVGIPKTLPRRYGIEVIREILSLLPGMPPDDGNMIKAAIELGRTRTGVSNRGKGLLDLLKLIDQVGGGTLHILSRCGCYSYSVTGESVRNDEQFVEGTLIKWALPLNMALETLQELVYDDEADH